MRLGVMKDAEAEKFLLELCPRIGASAPELARRCGCLPLALRIAGSFLEVNRNWSLPEYLERLQARRLQTLRSADDAESDLETVFDESYQSLGEDERQKWRALSVFPASFDRPAASAVWNMDTPSAHDLLSCFCRYSLLDFLPSPAFGRGGGGEGEGRYSLHDLLRDFALARSNGEERETASQLHAAHYMQVLSTADDLYLKGGENILAGLSLFDREAEHIKTGQAWAAGNHARLCKDYPDAGAYVLDLRLTPGEKIKWLETALAAARQLKDRSSEGTHLGNLGGAYYSLGDARKAIEFYEKQLVIAREIGDRRGEGNALGNLGSAYAALGDARKAIEYHEKALVIDREIGDRRGEGADLGNLGLAYAALGDARKAIEFYEKQLVIVREIGDRRGEGAALGNLGNAYYSLGDARKAIEYHEKALVVMQEIGDKRAEGSILGNLGLAYAALGDARKAIEFYEQALVIAREIGDRRGEGNALYNMSNALYGLGEKARGVQLMKQALAIFEAIESPHAKWARDKLKEWGA